MQQITVIQQLEQFVQHEPECKLPCNFASELSMCLLAGRQSLTCEVLRGPTIIHQYGWAAKMKTLLGSVAVTLQNRCWSSITKQPDYSKADQSGEEAFLEASCVVGVVCQESRHYNDKNLLPKQPHAGLGTKRQYSRDVKIPFSLWIAGLQPAPKAGAIESFGPSWLHFPVIVFSPGNLIFEFILRSDTQFQ